MTPAQAAAAAAGFAALTIGVAVIAALATRRPTGGGACVFTPTRPAASCRAAYEVCGATNTTVLVASSVPGEPPFNAWCDYGFTLAAVVDGSSERFVYGSPLWTNLSLLNADPAALHTVAEAKLAPFVSTAGTTIRLTMAVRDPRPPSLGALLYGAPVDVDVPGNFTSLRALFAGGAYVPTAASLGFSSCGWRGLTPGGSTYQPHCNRQGINVQLANQWGTWQKYRIGIIYNQEDHCASPDSAQGVGGEVTWSAGPQAGVAAGAWAPRGQFGQTLGSLFDSSVSGTMRLYVSSRPGPPPGGDCDPARNATAAALAAYVPPYAGSGAVASGGGDGWVAAAVVVALVTAAAMAGAALVYRRLVPPPSPPPPLVAGGSSRGSGSHSSVGHLLPPLGGAAAGTKPQPPSHHRNPTRPASMLSRLLLPAAGDGRTVLSALPSSVGSSSNSSSSFFGDLFAPKVVVVASDLPGSASPLEAVVKLPEAGEHGRETEARPTVTPPAQAALKAATAATKAAAHAPSAGGGSSSRKWPSKTGIVDATTQDTVFTYVAGTRIARLNVAGVAGGVGNGFSPAAVRSLASSRKAHRSVPPAASQSPSADFP